MKALNSYINERRGPLYIALVVDNKSQDKLQDLIPQYISDNFNPKEFCHHMTISFHTNFTDEILDWCKEHEGKTFNMTAYEIGISDKAMAVKVETDVPSTNELKHITLATNQNTKGKPVDSNYIKQWKAMPKIKLYGKVTYIYN